MKALTCPVIVEGISTRKDGSLGIRMGTPELSPDEKLAFLEIQGSELKMLLQQESATPVLKEVKREFERATSSQRLRSVLFVAWKQQGEPGDYDDFYRKKLDAYIDDVKSHLNPI